MYLVGEATILAKKVAKKVVVEKARENSIFWEKERIHKGCSPMSAEVLNGDAIADVESAKCDCCGLMEDCTPGYIARVRERHEGRWICGLCSEAVKDEISRSGRLISTEEALNRHMSFSKSFRSASPPANSTEHLIVAMRQLLRRSFDSPRGLRSSPSSPRRKGEDDSAGGGHHHPLARSESCMPTLAG